MLRREQDVDSCRGDDGRACMHMVCQQGKGQEEQDFATPFEGDATSSEHIALVETGPTSNKVFGYGCAL